MSLETVTNIIDLNPANPTGADAKANGDDHIRNIKTALRQAFAGLTGAVVVSGADGGAANVYTLTPATTLTAYGSRMVAVFSPIATNTGPVTLNISGLAAKAVTSVSGAALASGDLVVGRLYSAIYNGTSFQLEAVTQNYIDQIAVTGLLPGVTTPANAGKFYTTNGSTGYWAAIDGRGDPIYDMGNSGTTAQVVNYANGEGQKLTATGSFSLSATGFPAGRFAAVMLKLTNGGAIALASTGIVWKKADGTETTTFSSAGITLQSSGSNFILLMSYGDGTIYGLVR
jgi:hypothetical protein